MEKRINLGYGINPMDYPYFTINKLGRSKVYHICFDSLGMVQYFLRSDPPVNRRSFVVQSSLMGDRAFAGEPLEKAIEYCLGGYSEGFSEFMKLAGQLEAMNVRGDNIKRVETSFVGHRPNVPAYIAGAPKTMFRTVRVGEKKLINICVQLAYDKSTTKQQVRNRGILVLNLIRLLERNNYIVNFRLFESSIEYNEVFLCEVSLKQPGQKMDEQKCYYPMCGREFVRRIMLRIKESMPFDNNWGMSYGMVCDDTLTKKLLDIGPKDVFIGTPNQLGITGENLYRDADAFIRSLGLSDKIKVPHYQEMAEELIRETE